MNGGEFIPDTSRIYLSFDQIYHVFHLYLPALFYLPGFTQQILRHNDFRQILIPKLSLDFLIF